MIVSSYRIDWIGKRVYGGFRVVVGLGGKESFYYFNLDEGEYIYNNYDI